MTNSLRYDPTRRSILQGVSAAGLAGLGGGLIAVGETAPACAAPLFEAYNGVSGVAHQAAVKRLGKEFRPVSLSVYGDPSDPLYAAVWVRRGGPAWTAVHGLDARAYQAAFETWSSRGFAPTIVAATGSNAKAVFAAVFEQGVPSEWKARHAMTDAQFSAETKAAAEAQQKLRWAGIYGTPSDRRFIAVWHPNTGNTQWRSFGQIAPANYQGVFDLQTQIPNFRLACVAVASDGTLCAAFDDESIGAWIGRHGMSAAEYQAEFERQRAAGRMPICVQGGGAGAGVRYAAIFAGQDQPSPRTWSAIGQTARNLGRCEELVRAFMVKHGVRAAQLTIGQNGTTKLQRAYTWAEPGYRRTQVSDRFLLASNSKMFVAAAIQTLYERKTLQSGSRAYQLLGFSGPKDPRSDTITVQQLLDHNAGYKYDPTYDMRTIALARHLPGPAGKQDIAAFMYGRMLDYAPGKAPGGMLYNNYGYLLLTLVIEKVTGQGYLQYLRSQVLQPDGISEVEPYPTAASPRSASLVEADDSGTGPSALAPHSDGSVPTVFGGDGMVKETAIGSCGLAASATAMTQFIRRHAAWGNGARSLSARAGSTPGASTWAQSQDRGVDWALLVNTRQWATGSGKPFDDLTAAIKADLDRAVI